MRIYQNLQKDVANLKKRMHSSKNSTHQDQQSNLAYIRSLSSFQCGYIYTFLSKAINDYSNYCHKTREIFASNSAPKTSEEVKKNQTPNSQHPIPIAAEDKQLDRQIDNLKQKLTKSRQNFEKEARQEVSKQSSSTSRRTILQELAEDSNQTPQLREAQSLQNDSEQPPQLPQREAQSLQNDSEQPPQLPQREANSLQNDSEQLPQLPPRETQQPSQSLQREAQLPPQSLQRDAQLPPQSLQRGAQLPPQSLQRESQLPPQLPQREIEQPPQLPPQSLQRDAQLPPQSLQNLARSKTKPENFHSI